MTGQRAGVLASLGDGARLVVCVGPGGVGKTTVAAALGVAAALAGRRVLVLTVDPARRLADALGLDGLDDTIAPVTLPAPESEASEGAVSEGAVSEGAVSEGASSEGALYAAMIDTQHSFDRLMGRIASAESLPQILANPVYRAFSKTLARSHAYVATERLHEAMADPRFDLVILDTPPTRSALEILDAPRVLLEFLDQDVLRYFLEPAGRFRSLAALSRAGSRAVTALLRRIAGEGTTGALLSFFEVLAEQRSGFAMRAEANVALLRGTATRYCLVSTAEESPLADAAYLAAELRERHQAADMVLFNRAFADGLGRLPPVTESAVEALLAAEGSSAPLVGRLMALRARRQAEMARNGQQLQAFAQDEVGAGHAFLLPRSPRGPASINALAKLIEGAVSTH